MIRKNILLINCSLDACPNEGVQQIRAIIDHPELASHCALTIINNVPASLSFSPDLILLIPGARSPLEKLLNDLKNEWAKTPVIGLVCSKESSLHELYPLLANRIDDFLYCPFRECDLIPRIQRFLGHKADASPSSDEIKQIKEKWHLESLIGESPSFVHEIKKVLRLAPSDATVMILGETGTGKELFARAIHTLSSRHAKPFFPINCGAMPEQLFENELFGHVKGAYTDASSDQRGILAETEGGTLFIHL